MAEAEGPKGPEAEAGLAGFAWPLRFTHGFVSKVLTEGLPGGPEGSKMRSDFWYTLTHARSAAETDFFPLTSPPGVLMGMIVFAGSRWI